MSEGRFDVVAALDDERGIGKDGSIPWRLPGDVAYFKHLTRDTMHAGARNAVIMGRATWQSIPARFRPLPARQNVVLHRAHPLALPDGTLAAASLDQALALLEPDRQTGRIERVFLIGGGALYAEAVASPACGALYLTRIAGAFDCDVFFPPFEEAYQRTDTLFEGQESGLAYRIEVWQRRQPCNDPGMIQP